jgi:hypothetical protein
MQDTCLAMSIRAGEERLSVLAAVCAELNARFPGRVSAARNHGEIPPACAIRLAGAGLFATFGVIDATYFWTFDGGESCHYAKDKDVMRRILATEITTALGEGTP